MADLDDRMKVKPKAMAGNAPATVPAAPRPAPREIPWTPATEAPPVRPREVPWSPDTPASPVREAPASLAAPVPGVREVPGAAFASPSVRAYPGSRPTGLPGVTPAQTRPGGAFPGVVSAAAEASFSRPVPVGAPGSGGGGATQAGQGGTDFAKMVAILERILAALEKRGGDGGQGVGQSPGGVLYWKGGFGGGGGEPEEGYPSSSSPSVNVSSFGGLRGAGGYGFGSAQGRGRTDFLEPGRRFPR